MARRAPEQHSDHQLSVQVMQLRRGPTVQPLQISGKEGRKKGREKEGRKDGRVMLVVNMTD